MTARSIPLARPLIGTTLPFALPIGLSAFLLFSVQPLIGRLVLPVFGGTPAVWATSLFFFQTILLVGYLYGHISVTRLGWIGPPVHLGVAGLALVALLVAPSDISGLRDAGIAPVLDLVRRTPHPDDRRGVLIDATKQGTRLLAHRRQRFLELLESGLAEMPDDDQERLADLLDELNELMTPETAEAVPAADRR